MAKSPRKTKKVVDPESEPAKENIKAPEPNKTAEPEKSEFSDQEIKNLAWNIETARHHIMNENDEVDNQIFDEVWKPNWKKVSKMLPHAKKYIKDKDKRKHIDMLLEYGAKQR